MAMRMRVVRPMIVAVGLRRDHYEMLYYNITRVHEYGKGHLKSGMFNCRADLT